MFDMTNAQGYSQEQLDEMNWRLNLALDRMDAKPGAADRLKACLSPGKSVADHVAAHVQAQFDDEIS